MAVSTELYRIIDGTDEVVGYYNPADGQVELVGTSEADLETQTEGEVLGARREKVETRNMVTLYAEIAIILTAGIVWISWFIKAERNKYFNTED